MFATSVLQLFAAAALLAPMPAATSAPSFEGVDVAIAPVSVLNDELVTVSGSYRCAGVDAPVLQGNVLQEHAKGGSASGVISLDAAQCDGAWHPFEATSFGQFGFFHPGPAAVEIMQLNCTPACDSVPVHRWAQEVRLQPGR